MHSIGIPLHCQRLKHHAYTDSDKEFRKQDFGMCNECFCWDRSKQALLPVNRRPLFAHSLASSLLLANCARFHGGGVPCSRTHKKKSIAAMSMFDTAVIVVWWTRNKTWFYLSLLLHDHRHQHLTTLPGRRRSTAMALGRPSWSPVIEFLSKMKPQGRLVLIKPSASIESNWLKARTGPDMWRTLDDCTTVLPEWGSRVIGGLDNCGNVSDRCRLLN